MIIKHFIRPSHFRIILLTCLLLLLATVALAKSSEGYDLSWSTVDGGGGTSTGDVYSLGGIIGQPDAGTLSGGVYTLDGGFSFGETVTTYQYFIHMPLVIKNQ